MLQVEQAKQLTHQALFRADTTDKKKRKQHHHMGHMGHMYTVCDEHHGTEVTKIKFIQKF